MNYFEKSGKVVSTGQHEIVSHDKSSLLFFRNSTGDPNLVNKAAKVMEIMIENFAIASMFGSDNLQYFADVTCSGIIVTERFTYHYRYPSQQNIERKCYKFVSLHKLHPLWISES